MTELGNGKVLGLDIGTNSIGWALINMQGGRPVGILDMGVRVFDAGLDELEKDGKGVSRNFNRRDKRSLRRQTERRVRRAIKLGHILQKAGLLPPGDIDESEERNSYFEKLDRALGSPYILRDKALDKKLEPYEIGRAFYHLSQRRGFESNRKSKPKKDDERGKVKEGIKALVEKMADARTLGEYFAGLEKEKARIRGTYTHRDMYKDEFNQIWTAQTAFHPGTLTDGLKNDVFNAIFYQRPLKPQKNLIGNCEYEKGRKRAPIALLISQRFRYLQKVNDLEWYDDTGGHRLDKKQRESLIAELEKSGSLSLSKIKTTIGLKAKSKVEFNLERGGEAKLLGNTIAARLRDVFGEKWDSMPDAEKDRIVEDLRSIRKERTIMRRGVRVWGLDEAAAKKLSETHLEEGYLSLSRQAIEKVMPRLSEGESLPSILRDTYPERWEKKIDPMDTLPPAKPDKKDPDPKVKEVRNPAVERSITELRRVVNMLVSRHGKPGFIRVELARNLKQPAKLRERDFKNMRSREKERKSAADKIMKEAGITAPRLSDILKYRLAVECCFQCPYTGKTIDPARDLFGDHPRFDMEHIIPFERSLDDSMANKTLCDATENRHGKRGRTPWEAYGNTEKWEEIIGRVKLFSGDLASEKLRRFHMREDDVANLLDGFTNRQLSDTRYITKQATEYMGLLYGANADGIAADGKKRVATTAGGATAYLRDVWGLNAILSDGPGKSRDDHRHHAVDALVVALTDAGTVKALSDAAKRAPLEKRRLFGKVQPPWDDFWKNAKEAVETITVSHRVSRRVRGALHAETFYGFLKKDGKDGMVTKRINIEDISLKNLDDIDPAVCRAIKKKLDDLGGDPKKFKDEANLPAITGKDGRIFKIKKVRIIEKHNCIHIGNGRATRLVMPGSNHHLEIFKDLKTGNWEGRLVSMFEAHRRLKAYRSNIESKMPKKERKKTKLCPSVANPIIDRDHGPDKKFLFSLASGDIIEADNKKGGRELYIVSTVYIANGKYPRIEFSRINDARKSDEIKKSGDWFSPLLNQLRKLNCRKMAINPLGDFHYAND